MTEIGGDFVNLSWEKPIDDGGSRIQGYLIDKREIDSDTWQRVNAAICVPTQINISNLIEGRQYIFRVYAQNEAGLSLPSQASNTVTIKDPLSNLHFKYIITFNNNIFSIHNVINLLFFIIAAQPPEIVKPLHKIQAIQNQNAQFQCVITGVPKPNITWSVFYLLKNDNQIEI